MRDRRDDPLRTILFAPANHPRRTERLGDWGADAVVLDLEDAVAESEKAAARALVLPALARFDGPLRCVRVNAMETGLLTDDLDAVVGPDLDAIVIPKVESPDELGRLAARLEQVERARGLEVGSVAVLPIVETARGMLAAPAIAQAAGPRTITLLFGVGDFTVDLGIEPSAHGEELLHARSTLVLACRAAELAPPVDGPYLRGLDDEAEFTTDCHRARDLGFQGRIVIHPQQVGWANAAYSALDADRLQAIETVVTEFEAAEQRGEASIRVGNRFVDYPIYRLAKRRLDRHRATHHT